MPGSLGFLAMSAQRAMTSGDFLGEKKTITAGDTLNTYPQRTTALGPVDDFDDGIRKKLRKSQGRSTAGQLSISRRRRRDARGRYHTRTVRLCYNIRQKRDDWPERKSDGENTATFRAGARSRIAINWRNLRWRRTSRDDYIVHAAFDVGDDAP